MEWEWEFSMTDKKKELNDFPSDFWIQCRPIEVRFVSGKVCIYQAIDQKPSIVTVPFIHTRVVSPALDEAYREMERAVEKITSCCQVCTVCAACELKDSLEKLREARK